MSGRIEKEQLIENKLIALTQKQPQIIVDYLKSFGNKTAQTKQFYLTRVIKFCNYLKKYGIDISNCQDIKNINYSHIVSYVDNIKICNVNGVKRKKEETTCATEFYAIKHFCKYLKLCRYLEYDPCEGVEVPKDKKIHDVVSLSQEEINIIKNNIEQGVGSARAIGKQFKWKNRDLCIISLGITTGLRVSAIANLDVSDIDFQNKTLKTIEKGNYERTIYLSDKIIQIINNWLTDRSVLLGDYTSNALFISVKKQRMSTNTIRAMLKKYTYNINKKITPHKLRSTAATNLYEKTEDIYLVADVLGHHNIQNTKRYAAVSNSRKQYAVDTLSNLI